MKQIQVLFFGPLSDIVGSETMKMNGQSVNDIHQQLVEQFPNLQQRTFRFALNQEIIYGDFPLKDGDELALLPPFAGG